MRFDWDDHKAGSNKTKHGISFEEASKVFYDPNAVTYPDKLHSFDEERFVIIGYSSLRLLMMVYVEFSDDLIRIISARNATRSEKKRYEKGE
ncbi:MAG: BrnT family toxin [Acidobacteriota bacterium]|nr:BrnT family toxin [Acidobacteriota bacterium]